MFFVYIYNKQQLNPTTMINPTTLREKKEELKNVINSLEYLCDNGIIPVIEKIHASVILENAIEVIDKRIK